MVKKIILLFPLWAILGSIVAYFEPSTVVWLKPYIVPLLAIIMLCMGVTLTIDDFKRAFTHPKIIIITAGLQFILMPLVAYILSLGLGLSVELMIGMILVGGVSGGTASNVMAYLGKGDVALSITMTAISTILSIALTPLLTLIYVGQSVPVPALSMLVSILKVVFVPVVLGVIVNYFFNKFIQKYRDIFALISIIAIVTIVAIVVGLNVKNINTVGGIVIVAIVLHNGIGMIGGYYGAKFFGYNKTICKTIAFEVGMQNSGLAVTLALKYFAPLSALPGALFSIWHNVSGSILAGYWSKDSE